MFAKKVSGLLRFVAALTVSVILLPVILRLYLDVSPEATAKDVWVAFVQTAPFAENIATVMLPIWAEAQSGADSVLDLIISKKIDFSMFLSMEMGEMIFTSVMLTLLTNVIGNNLLKVEHSGFWNHAADTVFQVLLAFSATLIVDRIFYFFSEMLTDISGWLQGFLAYLYSGGLGIGGIIMLCVSGLMILDALALTAIGCLKLCVSYGAFLTLLMYSMQGGIVWHLYIGIICELILLWLLMQGEKIFLKGKQ